MALLSGTRSVPIGGGFLLFSNELVFILSCQLQIFPGFNDSKLGQPVRLGFEV